MKTLFATFVLLLPSNNSFASDWSFNYLDKLYQKNPERCYERCKTIMKFFPNEESPYFFAMKIQLEELNEQTKVKSKNSRMIKAIDYAKYFDKNASTGLKQRIQWDTVQPFLFERASEIRMELDDENLNSNMKQLDSKWEKYTGEKLEKELVSKTSTNSETLLIEDQVLTEAIKSTQEPQSTQRFSECRKEQKTFLFSMRKVKRNCLS